MATDVNDLDLPYPLSVLRDGAPAPLRGVTVTALNDQHAYLSDPAGALRVGDWVECGISHPCTMFDRWTALPLIDGESRVVDLIRTFF